LPAGSVVEAHFSLDDMHFALAVVADAEGELGPQIDGAVVGGLDDEAPRRFRDEGAEPPALAADFPLGIEGQLGGAFHDEGRSAEKFELGEPRFKVEWSRREGLAFAGGMVS